MIENVFLFFSILSLGFVYAPDDWKDLSPEEFDIFWAEECKKVAAAREIHLQKKLDLYVAEAFKKQVDKLFCQIHGNYRLCLSPLKKLCGAEHFSLAKLPEKVRSVILETTDVTLFTLNPEVIKKDEDLEVVTVALREHFSKCYKKNNLDYKSFERLMRTGF